MKSSITRKLTVKPFGDLYQQRVGNQSAKSRIDLVGKWLHEAGFKPGDTVTVVVDEEQLVISVEESDIERINRNGHQ